MPDILGILCVLGIVLAVIAVLGHGVWLLVAAVFRAMSGEKRPASSLRRNCPTCGSVGSVVAGVCRFCNYRAGAPSRPVLSDDLEATGRQLDRMHQQGRLTDEQHIRLVALVRDDLARIRGAPRATAGLPSSAASKPPPIVAETGSSESEPMLAELVEPPAVPAGKPQPPVPVVEPIATPREAKPPSRPLADILQGFMEEKNIRLGELVAGMLIVGSAIGLVISLWSTLGAIRYFPALLFMLITVAMYGAGMYTLRRWRLRSTSRGLLVIATLLVPLNFLAAIALSENQEVTPVTDPLYITAVMVGLVTFGLVVHSASRALLIQGWPLAWIAVMGTSAAQLVIARQASPGMLTPVWTLMAVPLACFLVASGGQLMLSVRWRRFTRRRVGQMFLLLGLASFALFMPAGLLISKTEALRWTLAQLSPALSLMAAGVLGLALVVHQRATSPALSTLRMAGTSLAVFAAMVMLAAVALGWPDPPLLVAIGLANFAALTALALISRTPILHVPAVVSAALAAVVGYHMVAATDQTDGLLYVLLMGRSGLLLLVLAGLAAGGAALWRYVGRVAEARNYLIASGGLAATSVLVALYAGFFSLVDAQLATPVFAICAAGLLGGAVVTRRSEIVPAGSVLLLVALVHALSPQLNEPLAEFLTRLRIAPDRPLLVALLLHAAICTVLSIASTYWRRGRPADEVFARRAPLTCSALISSVVALPIVLVVMRHDLFAAHAVYALCIAVLWLTLALLHGWRPLFSAFQTMATVSLLFAVTAICKEQSWWTGRLLDPRHLQAELSALALWSVVWVVVRRVAKSSQLAQRLFVVSWIAVDRLVLAIVVRGVVLLSLAACLPAVLSELWPATASGAATALQPLDMIIMAFVAVFSALAIAAWTRADAAPRAGRWAIGLNASVVGGLLFLAVGGVKIINWYWSHVGVDLLHEVGHGVGAWAVVALAIVALAAHGAVRSSTWSLLGLLGVGLAVVLLISAAADDAASVLRWELAIYGGLIAAAVCGRRSLAALAIRMGVNHEKIDRLRAAAIPRTLMLAITAVPLLGLSGLAVVADAMSAGPAASDVEGMFAGIGAAASHGPPLLVLAITLGAYAVRERLREFALAGSLVAVLAAALFYTIPGWMSAAHTSSQTAAGLFYSTALALAACTLLWRVMRLESVQQISEPLAVQLGLLVVAVVVPVAWAAVAIFVQPGQLVEAVKHLGGSAGFAAVLLSGVALGWSLWRRRQQVLVHLIAAAAMSLAVLVAAATFGYDTAGNWLAFHVLTSGGVIVAALACLVTYAAALPGATRSAIQWSLAIGGAIVLLALRSAWSDPLRPGWPTAAAGAVAVLAALLAWRCRSQPLAYASTALAALATTIFITGPWTMFGQSPDSPRALIELIQAILIAVSLTATLWLAADLWWRRRAAAAMDVRFQLPAVHRITGVFGVLLVAAMSGFCVVVAALAREFFAATSEPTIGTLIGSLAAASLAVLLFASLWDRDAWHAIAGLYLLGMTAAAGVLDRSALRFELRADDLVFYAAVAMSVYVVLTGMLWSYRTALRTLARGAGIPEVDRRIEHTWRWLPTATLMLVTGIVVIDFWVVLTFGDGKEWMPLAAATTTALAAVGVAALAHERHRERMPLVALLVAAAALVDLAWAMQSPAQHEYVVLYRAVRLLMALAIGTFAYGVVLVRIARHVDNWFGAARRAATLLGGGALLALLVTLALEGAAYVPRLGAPLADAEVAQVAIVLVALAAAFVSLALLPGRDPLGLSEKGRMAYVYAAEAVASLLFLHIFLTMPELFKDYLKPYWPLIVLAIAYAGAGASELFGRAGLNVLAEPLRRSGALLPLLPALAFWTYSPSPDVTYSTVLFAAGLLYVLLAMWRGTFIYAIAAALAGNAGLWAVMHEHGVTILTNPQFWMIPPAVSMLVGAQLNRDRLSEAQLTAIRYASVIVIYVSSTGEMFIRGMGENLWPPMLLAALSIAGVLVSIMLQVRAFLYLGCSFLLLAIVSMVWHAAQRIDHTWPWWAFGIVSGVAILVLFGVFEKNRRQVQQMVDRMRQWDP